MGHMSQKELVLWVLWMAMHLGKELVAVLAALVLGRELAAKLVVTLVVALVEP